VVDWLVHFDERKRILFDGGGLVGKIGMISNLI
jgi:hypothetical protein